VKGITPLVYCNTNYASNYLNSTIVAVAPDIWIANWTTTTYGNPITGTGNPPQGAWGSGSNWDFWQYSSTGSGSANGASSSAIDLDVFNGSDINVLKQNYVTGAAAIPSGASPADGATNVNPGGLILNWADSAGATAYDVYLDNLATPVATNISVSQWTVPSGLSGGTHTWKIVAKGSTSDDDTWTTTTSAWTFTAVNSPPSTPVYISPANNSLLNSRPVTFVWQTSTNATSYDFYFNGQTLAGSTNLSSPTWTGLSSVLSQKFTWDVVARNDSTSQTASGPTWTATLDTTPPTASLGSQLPLTGQAFLDFNVTYTDTLSLIDVNTLDSNDITVSGPNSYSQSATFVSVDNAANGSPRVATYRIPAPGGFW